MQAISKKELSSVETTSLFELLECNHLALQQIRPDYVYCNLDRAYHRHA